MSQSSQDDFDDLFNMELERELVASFEEEARRAETLRARDARQTARERKERHQQKRLSVSLTHTQQLQWTKVDLEAHPWESWTIKESDEKDAKAQS